MAVMENPPEPLRLTRSELYARAWTKPTIRLAEEFGITNFLLSGICKKHQIPTPPAGYWSKVAHGKALSRPPLPGDGDILIDIGQARTPGFRASKPRPPIQRADRVAPVVPPPTPAQALVEPHAKVLKTVARLRAGNGRYIMHVELASPLAVALTRAEVEDLQASIRSALTGWYSDPSLRG